MTASASSAQTTQNGNAERASAPARSTDDLDLDALLDKGHRELSELYAAAEVPSIEELSGDLRGRMLVSPWVSKPVADALRRIARTPYFPWRGKSFSAKSPDRGEGINPRLPRSHPLVPVRDRGRQVEGGRLRRGPARL